MFQLVLGLLSREVELAIRCRLQQVIEPAFREDIKARNHFSMQSIVTACAAPGTAELKRPAAWNCGPSSGRVSWLYGTSPCFKGTGMSGGGGAARVLKGDPFSALGACFRGGRWRQYQ